MSDRNSAPPLPQNITERWRSTPGRVGICCSGGGIRSAAFNLGALQALQQWPTSTGRSVLATAEYLAAVSGGAYIAAATAIVQRDPTPPARGQRRVPSDWDPGFDTTPPYASGSPEERWLRHNSSYLAHGLRGKLRLVTTIVLGVLLNLSVVATGLVAVGLPLGVLGAWFRPRLAVGAGRGFPAPAPTSILGWTPPFGWSLWSVIVAVVAAVAVLACLLMAATRLGDAPRNPMLRIAKWCGMSAVVLYLVTLGLPALVAVLRDARAALTGDATTTAGNARELGGWLTIIAALGVPPLVLGVLRTWIERFGPTTLSRLRRLISSPVVAAWIATPLVIGAGFMLAYNFGVAWAWQPRSAWVTAAAAAVLAIMIAVIDPTASSLHPFYKSRLCSAFAVERVPESISPDRARERNYAELVPLSETGCEGWPDLIVCAAANISDEGATPPGRNAAPFTFTREYVGGPEVGYVPTTTFEAVLGRRRCKDITLAAAMAVSGAALSPSMGKMGSRSQAFLLALTNVRLGVWLPNPRCIARLDDDSEQGRSKQNRNGRTRHASDSNPLARFYRNWPRPRLIWLLREMLGRNRLNGRYLYISDGGHYENLGLIELLRRGCTTIYCFDASGDPADSFATLGQAMALARTELGVEIPADPDALKAPSKDELGDTAHLIVPFTYRQDDGHDISGNLIYVRSQVTADAPWDVRAYRQRYPRFPNDSTVNQLYTDEKFEAYRALGMHNARAALTDHASARAQTRARHRNGGPPVRNETLASP